jgi:hypothetical protein
MIKKLAFPLLGLVAGFVVGDLVTEPFRPYLIWKGALLAVDHVRNASYGEGYQDAVKEYSHTGYTINRANVRCSSTGNLEFSDMNIDEVGMDYTFRIQDVLSHCVDNSDRRL